MVPSQEGQGTRLATPSLPTGWWKAEAAAMASVLYLEPLTPDTEVQEHP